MNPVIIINRDPPIKQSEQKQGNCESSELWKKETDERCMQPRQIEGIKSNHGHIYAADEQSGCVNRKNVTARERCSAGVCILLLSVHRKGGWGG